MTNKKYLTNKEIIETIESSFSPYRCVAELCDDPERVRFRIYNENDKAIYTCPEMDIYSMDMQKLKNEIIGHRYRLTRLGFHLDKSHGFHK